VINQDIYNCYSNHDLKIFFLPIVCDFDLTRLCLVGQPRLNFYRSLVEANVPGTLRYGIGVEQKLFQDMNVEIEISSNLVYLVCLRIVWYARAASP
jgi:hypothetical protein